MKLLSEEMSAYQIYLVSLSRHGGHHDFRLYGSVSERVCSSRRACRCRWSAASPCPVATVLFVLGAKTIEFADAIAIFVCPIRFLMTVLGPVFPR